MPSRTSNETKPFLSYDEAEPNNDENIPQRGIYRKHHVLLLMAQMILLALNITFASYNFIAARRDSERSINSNMSGRSFSPVRSVLQYKIEHLPGKPPSPFVGEPRREVDEAWSHLLRSSMIRLTGEELKRMNKTSIALRDGSGYIGYLEGLHMLHCIKRLYQYQHQAHYPELKGTNAFLPGHWDHCLEVLREGIMCNADVSVNTYHWKGDHDIKGDRSGPRKCTDWSRVQSWLGERAIEFHDKEEFLSRLVRDSEHVVSASTNSDEY